MGVVTEGIIAMPYELAMADELTRMQFYQTVTSEIATLRARLETVEAETRERIAAALDEEADLIPCAEDAMVTRSNARLVRANFSYEDAERLEAEEDAAAIRNLEPRHD